MEQDRQKEIMTLFFQIKYAEEKIEQYQRKEKGYDAARRAEQIKYHENMAEMHRQDIITLGATEKLLTDLEEYYRENELFKYLHD